MVPEETTIYGLRNSTKKTQVSLREMSVEAQVQGFIANVEYNLRYYNDEEEPIEASFVFPLHDNSAIYRFEAKICDRLVVGEVQEKEQARETYDDAIASGRAAFLMEESQTSGDIFECLVGNLPPHQDAVVTFAYVIELELEVDGGVCFQLPSVIKPRYQHDTGKDQSHLQGSSVPSAGTAAKRSKDIAPEVYSEGSSGFRFSFKIEVTGHRTIRTVEAAFPSDRINCVFKNDEHTHIQATLANEFQFDHDLKIILLYREPFQPHVVMETGDPSASGFLKQHVAMLNFYPDLSTFDKDAGKGEYIFILDRSASMGGSHILHARTAVMEFLKILPPDSYFNIVSFGSSHTMLGERESLKNTPENNKMALMRVSTMGADMGGTEIGRPLRAVYDLPTFTGYPRTLFLLTDGGVSDTVDVINLVKRKSQQARVFTFGIGHGASTALVTGIARAGGGRHEMITDLRKLTSKVQQMLVSSIPCARDVTLDWQPPVDCSIIPTELPPIFIGQRMIVFAVFDPEKMKESDCTVTLKGCIGDRQFEYSLPVRFDVTTTDIAPVHRLAAKRWIKELSDEENHGNELPSKRTRVRRTTTTQESHLRTQLTGAEVFISEGGVVSSGRLLQHDTFKNSVQLQMSDGLQRWVSSSCVITSQGQVYKPPVVRKRKASETDNNTTDDQSQSAAREPTDFRSELIDNKDRIILVSCSANVISKYTSFVGVDKVQTVSPDTKPEHQVIPTPQAQADLLSTGDVNALLQETIDICRANISSQMERAECLDRLDCRADLLQAGASQFEASAGKVRRNDIRRRICCILLIVLVIVVIIAIILAPILATTL